MDDSSQNPYIPQESEQIRQKVYERQSPLGRIVKLALIVTAIIAVVVGISLFFVIPRTTAHDQEARVKFADILQPPDQVLKRVPIDSTLGFKLNYDNRVYSSYAEVGDSTAGSDNSAAIKMGETYENNDLRIKRAYNFVRIRPIESVESSRALATLPPELQIFATVTDKDLVTASAKPDNKGLSKLSLFVKLDSDKRLAKKVADDKTVVAIEASKPVSASIGNVDYQKVRFTTTNDNRRVSNVKYDDCYYTIQNDQPYSVCVSNVRPTNVSAASLVEQVFDSIAYEQPTEPTGSDTTKKTSYAYPLARLAQATDRDSDNESVTGDSADSSDSSEAPLLTVTPSYYSDAGSLQSIAKNQPSVLRIGTLYCANLSLKYENGETATTLSDACVGNVASGVFVSSDGYIATTGHAIRSQKKAAINGYINFATDQDQMLDRLQRVLDYLLKAKIILQSDADYLKTGAQIGDQEALAKIENIGSVIPDNFITPVDEEYTYAVQPSDKPIVVNRTDSNKPAFAYSDSVLEAKYVASNYDASKAIQQEFGSKGPSADIGLLKVQGSYPAVPIIATEDVKANDTLTTIGYAAYTDSSLVIDKIRNAPIATTSKVEQAYKKDEGRLIQTNMPVLPGNDGAPVFSSSGELVGLSVYGLSYCPDQQCFANGTVRSSNELLELIEEKNVTLATEGKSAATWRSGVNEFFKANYAASTSSFANADYAFNRWAKPLGDLSSSLKGSAKDTSLMNQLQAVAMTLLIVSSALTVILATLYLLHRRSLSRMQVGLYGVQQTQATPVSQEPNQGYVPPQLPPVPPSAPPVLPGPSSESQPPQPQPPTSPPQPPEDPFYK